MTYKNIAIIALVLMLACVIPASAVWSNDNWIDSEHSEQYFDTAKVVTDPATGVTSKYNPITSETDLMTYQGHVYGNLKSGHVLEGGERFLISNDLAPNVTKEYKFNSDGLFDDYFAAGNYTITLPQGTGSAAGVYSNETKWIGNLHSEVAHITVVVGRESYFTFIGNSVPTIPAEAACVNDYTIVEASYCGESIPAVTREKYRYIITSAIQPTPESYNYVGRNYGDYNLIPAKPAYDDYVDVGWLDGDYYRDMRGGYHYIGHDLGKYDKIRHDATDAYYKHVGYYNGDYTYTPANPGHNAVWSEWSISLPPEGSVYEQRTVTDKSALQGGCAYPKAELQSIVDGGVLSFLFDNRPAEGGIFDASGINLLTSITDPASGIQKHVSITYNAGCGTSDKTVEAMEYEVINL